MLAALLPGLCAAASLDVYLSAPGEQSSYVAGANTETFNTLPAGIQTTPYVSAIGTYEFSPVARFASLNADQYGGADGSRYVSLGAQSASSNAVTLQLGGPNNYFGFWWSAGDSSNGVSFYYNSIFLARLSTADIVGLLGGSGGSVTAVNGTTYSSSLYYGNPNNRSQDGSEPFSYVNVFAENTRFNRIVFDNSGQSGSGFESDNHSVHNGAAAPNGPSVFVESVPTVPVETPEPAALSLSAAGLFGLSLVLRRRREAR